MMQSRRSPGGPALQLTQHLLKVRVGTVGSVTTRTGPSVSCQTGDLSRLWKERSLCCCLPEPDYVPSHRSYGISFITQEAASQEEVSSREGGYHGVSRVAVQDGLTHSE